MWDTLLDWSIVYSFDRSGYQRHARHFQPIDDTYLRGRRYFITGGTRGIGAALAGRLLDAGAEVIVSGRHADTFEGSPLAQRGARFLPLNTADIAAIATLKLPPLDGLVCNAGGMPDTCKRLTLPNGTEGELIFSSQALGHYALIRHCIDSQILNIGSPIHLNASGGMYLAKLRLDDLAWRQRPYDKVAAYANAKRAQVVLNEALAKRHTDFHFACSHPGWVGTQALMEALPGFSRRFAGRLRTAEQGADTMYWALARYWELPSGRFWFDRKARRTEPFFWTRTSEGMQEALMALCEEVWQDAHF